jgi:choline dehydrogenase
MPNYDVVVVGAGSAGCALTSRLCHLPSVSVCLIEAGPDYGPVDSGDWPAELLSVQDLPHTHDWGYREERAGGQAVPEARAKVVGGCSAHNQCGAFWGLPADYDAWAAEGLEGWSYHELVPLMQQLERATPGSPYRGTSGIMETRAYGEDELASWQRLWLDTALRAGFPRLADLNAPEPAQGVAPAHANVQGDLRWNAAFAFLDPVRSHPGLTILSDTMAEKLVLHDGRAVSLLCHAQGRLVELRASLFVLCGGTYGTPLLLLRSGVGQAQHLQQIGIPSHIDLAGVGQNLHDHPGIALCFEPSALGRELVEADLTHHRFFQSQVVLRARSRQVRTGFDLHLVPYQTLRQGESASFEILVFALSPRSRGQVVLQGKEVDLPPRISFNWLTDVGHQDASVLMDGLELARRLGQTAPLAGVLEQEREPGARVSTVNDLVSPAESHVITYGHAVGTCKMGPRSDPGAVVSNSGQVYGTSNVFVADASLVPQIPRAPTNFTCFLIGWHIAECLSRRLSHAT